MTNGPESLLEIELARVGFSMSLRLEWQSRTLVLFGASGSGKTTLLRVLLGLEPAARARVRLAGEWLDDPERGLRTPVHERRLGWVPQSPTLFPDRNVERNIRFGARTTRRTGGSTTALSEDWIGQAIEVLGLGDLLTRAVGDLSGGERQRVALARAIATRPRALLLDEPLAALDLGLRARILPYLIRIRDELDLPIVHITHDPDEAMLLGEEIAVLDAGRLIAQGAPRETLWSQAVHSLSTRMGVENVLEVRGASPDGPSTLVRTTGGTELETPWAVGSGEELCLGLRAEDILIALDRPGRISARNLCPGRIVQIESHLDNRLVHVDVGSERLISKLTQRAVAELDLEPGTDVYLIIKSQALRRIG
ncbi:MAG: molybdenum ABC transporter ATP-binding protein [Deltaproteobacteria bacterium]|nr:molybdenum ABC transporter ATP-binding protein [Deltaproteobacteria bacterium]